jgi:hypothetical protein
MRQRGNEATRQRGNEVRKEKRAGGLLFLGGLDVEVLQLPLSGSFRMTGSFFCGVDDGGEVMK